MALNPRLKPGDVSLKSAPGPDGVKRWVATGRCAACGLEVTETQPAVVYRPPARVVAGLASGLYHWPCAPDEARTAPEDAPRVIRFNTPQG